MNAIATLPDAEDMSRHTDPDTDTDELRIQVAMLRQQMQQIEGLIKSVEELKRPRPTNWLAVLGICFMALTPISSILVFYVRSEVQPLKQQAEYDQRDRTWLYDSIEKHLTWQDRQEERLWQRVYGENLSPFVPPPKK